MSTYEELQLIVSVAALIVAILTYTHKKQPSCPGKLTTIFLVQHTPGRGAFTSLTGCLVKCIISHSVLFVKHDYNAAH